MIKTIQNQVPAISSAAWVAETAVIVGDVTLHPKTNIWYGAVLRGDESAITIGEGTNIQDLTMVHSDIGYPTTIGKEVTIGHGVILHGCTVGDHCTIGMGAILLNGSSVGEGSIIGAGTLVTQGTAIPSGVLALGSPAKVVRPLRPDELEGICHSAQHYHNLAKLQLPLFSKEAHNEKT